MDYLRHHLGHGVERARPELATSEQQTLVDQIVALIESYDGNRQPRQQGPGSAANSRNGHFAENRPASESEAIGFVVGCRPDGRIAEVIEDRLGQGSRLAPDVGFSDIVSPFHSRRAARFLRSIQPDHASYDCALSVLRQSGMTRLFCSGFSVGAQIVVVATLEPLATSVPPELPRLAEKKPARLGPVLAELAAWKKNQKGTSAASAAEGVETSDRLASPEITASHSTPAGRRRLLELAAHDLRNPISGILAACQYLLEEASRALEPHQVLMLCSIESSSRLALQLIEDMAEIPSIQLRKPQLELRPIDLASVAQQAVSAIQSLADNMKVKVYVRVREHTPVVRGDAMRLSEALHGLLVNAVGPSPAAGQIELIVGSRSGVPTILVHREYSVIAGRPAPAPAGRSGYRGTHRRLSDIHAALLLARTRRIVEAHGGALQAETPGKHACSWTVTLPAMAGHAARRR